MQISFCSLWNLNRGIWTVPRSGHESGMCCMASCATQKQYFMVPPSPGRNCEHLLLPNEVLTLMTGIRIKSALLNARTHCEVRRRKDGLLSGHGRELKEQPGCRDLRGPSLSPLALQIHHTVTRSTKENGLFLTYSSYISWINVLTEKVNPSQDSNALSFTYA